MTCESIELPGGGRGIICGSFKPAERCMCGRPATVLCDYVIGKRSRTCDAPLCEACACQAGPDRDLCPRHALRGSEGGVQNPDAGADASAGGAAAVTVDVSVEETTVK